VNTVWNFSVSEPSGPALVTEQAERVRPAPFLTAYYGPGNWEI
jgi:hypothetical protein